MFDGHNIGDGRRHGEGALGKSREAGVVGGGDDESVGTGAQPEAVHFLAVLHGCFVKRCDQGIQAGGPVGSSEGERERHIQGVGHGQWLENAHHWRSEVHLQGVDVNALPVPGPIYGAVVQRVVAFGCDDERLSVLDPIGAVDAVQRPVHAGSFVLGEKRDLHRAHVPSEPAQVSRQLMISNRRSHIL